MTETQPQTALDRALVDYRAMRTIRRFEERIVELREAGQVQGSVHLCCGHEAIAVGACRTLTAADALTATYRGHHWAIARGLPLDALFAELMGRNSPLCGGRGGSAYLSSAAHGFLGENSIVAAGLPVALGAALAARHDGSHAVSLVAIGEGALNQGAAHETFNLAAVYALPLVVVVENNVWSELTPIRDMVRIEELHTRAAGYGFPGVSVEGRDVRAVEEAVAEAVARARSAGGPSLVEAHCDRLQGHYVGDIQHYRTAEELEEANGREPLVRLRQGHAEDAERFDRLDRDVEDELDEAVERALAVAPADAATVGMHVHG
jgi:TPP-dependent pyruvate/acetoin dehydrogenase alpha subunit